MRRGKRYWERNIPIHCPHGEEHPDTLSIQNNLGSTLSDLGRNEEALKMKKDVYEKRKKILGEEDPSTLISLSNLIGTLYKLGNTGYAIELQIRLMKNYIKTLGEKDKKTIRAIVRLAEFYIHTGKKEDARKAAEYAKRIMDENGVIDNTLMNRINSCIKKST